MFKKLLLSLSIVTAVGAAGILGTQALLSDEAVLSANTFSTGTADLQIARDDTAYLDSVTGFNDQLNPGQTKSYYVWLRNNNSGFEMAVAVQSTVPALTGGIGAEDVLLTFTPVQDATNTPDGDPVQGPYSLNDLLLVSGFNVGNNLSNNEYQRYRMDVSLDSSVNQSGTVGFDLKFTGTQVDPQL